MSASSGSSVADSPGSPGSTTPLTTTPRKTRGLTLSADPVSRLREMHELDNPTSAPTATPTAASAPVAPAIEAEITAARPQTELESKNAFILASNQDSMEENNHASKKAAKQESNQSGMPAGNHVRKASGSGGSGSSRAGESDIVRALRRALKAPYADQGPRPALTTLSTRITVEISERLDFACSITGLKKQEVMQAALRDYFDKLAGEGE